MCKFIRRKQTGNKSLKLTLFYFLKSTNDTSLGWTCETLSWITSIHCPLDLMYSRTKNYKNSK